MSAVVPVRLLALSGTAVAALLAALPVAAQEMGYEERVFEYAHPVPPGSSEPVYVRQPVVQDVPQQGEDAYETDYGAEQSADGDGQDSVVEYPESGPAYSRPPYAPPPPQSAYPYYQAYPQQNYAGPPATYGYDRGYPVAYPPMPPVIDRDAWIADCRAYLDERSRRADRGAVAGGLLGAVAGGVIGNRIADGERLGGTLIGGGIGGLAGLFIGQAIALAGGDEAAKDCKNWLRTYEESYAGGGQWPAQGYYPYPGPMWGGWDGRWHQHGPWQSNWSSSGWGGWWSGYVVVPQTTVIVTHGPPMVPVVREIVREEWVEEEVVSYSKVTAPPPPPVQKPKVRYIKAKPKPAKYIKQK